MGVGEQQRVVQPGAGDGVAAGSRDAFDEAVDTQAAQVVGHLAEQGVQEGVHSGVADAQSGDAGGGGGDDGGGQVGEGLCAADRVVADGLDAKQAPVSGEKSSCRRAGRLVSRLVTPKSCGSLMVVSVRSALPSCRA